MGAPEQKNIGETIELNERPARKKSNYFTKLQAFILIFSTLLISLGGGYIVSDKLLWSNENYDRVSEQLEHYKALVDAEPNNPEHRVNLGFTYHLMDENEAAIKQLLVATDLEDDYFGAYFNLGLVYIAEKRYNDAIISAQKSVELAPRDYRSHLLAGMAYREMEMYDEADKSLQEALNLVPTNTDIINEIARLAEDKGKLEEAEKLYKEALSYDPLYKPASEGLDRIAAKDNDNE